MPGYNSFDLQIIPMQGLWLVQRLNVADSGDFPLTFQ